MNGIHRRLNVLTLPNGVRSSARREADSTLKAFVPLLRLAIGSGEKVAIPVSWGSGWAVEMASFRDLLFFRVTNPNRVAALTAVAIQVSSPVDDSVWELRGSIPSAATCWSVAPTELAEALPADPICLARSPFWEPLPSATSLTPALG